jgi:citrate lyase beta subunit
MPATRADLADVICHCKVPELRSLVICLEDAVADSDVDIALRNLEQLLLQLHQQKQPFYPPGQPSRQPLLFVRPRNAEMAARLSEWPLISEIDGFVIPKLTLDNLPVWEQALAHPDLLLMPTLETPETFNPAAMVELGEALKVRLGERIVVLRIGGNDLMGCLGLRRNSTTTLYSTPMSYLIPMVSGVMGSLGFSLSAPVFEQLASPQLLQQELDLDIAHGMVGKTAIHPCQITLIHDRFRVNLEDLNAARMIVQDQAPAVFRHNDAMCEPATHQKWARGILERAKWYGVKPQETISQDGPLGLTESRC